MSINYFTNTGNKAFIKQIIYVLYGSYILKKELIHIIKIINNCENTFLAQDLIYAIIENYINY